MQFATRQARVRQIEQRLALQRAGFARRRFGIGCEAALHFGQIAGDDRRKEVVLANLRPTVL